MGIVDGFVKSTIDAEKWNHFVLEQDGSFLQSWEWGEFQENLGRRVWRLTDNSSLFSGKDFGETRWVAQFIEYKLPMGKKYWYCPRGPLFKSEIKHHNSQAQILKQIKDFVAVAKETIEKERAMFFRIGPEILIEQSNNWPLNQLGFKRLPYDIEPSQTLILDIAKSEEELLAQMHEKTRYNIKLAERKGVKIKIIDVADPDFDKNLAEFYRLMGVTAKRQGIRIFPKEYYKKQLTINHNLSPKIAETSSGIFVQPSLNLKEKKNYPQSFSKQENDSFAFLGNKKEGLKNFLFLAYYQNKAIAANLAVFFGQTATYLHGGSDNDYRALMAPHLLQWAQIREAKKQGCSKYDFWGYDEKKWPGISRFKKGFGGQQINYLGLWDYPLDKKWYLIYRAAQKIRR